MLRKTANQLQTIQLSRLTICHKQKVRDKQTVPDEPICNHLINQTMFNSVLFNQMLP